MPKKTHAIDKNGESRELVVLVHGYKSNARKLASIEREIKIKLKDADILKPRYNLDRFKNTSPFEIAGDIEELIRSADKKKADDGTPYRKIILIGYSSGALLVRKAYVWGWGSTEDRPAYERKTPKHDWVRRVDRIILIAGMNRGWSLEIKPKHMNWFRFLLSRLLLLLMRLFPVEKFLKEIERGSPFVADLRIQWVNLAREYSDQLAPVIQLLGTEDEFVAKDDNKDLETHKNFIIIPIQGANHSTLLRLSDPQIGEQNREKFNEALLHSIAALKRRYDCVQLNPRMAHIVFIMHGIRDFGGWTAAIRQILDSKAQELKLDKPIVVTARYGYFPIIGFLLLKSRQVHVRWFIDKYTEYIAEYPDSKTKVSFIGHSNGTYLAASALERCKSLRFHNVSFAGSVVPSGYPWDQIIDREERTEKLRNDLASADWVVAIFPKFFDKKRWNDIGSGGFDGFIDNAANKYEQEKRFFKGRHDAAIRKSNHESLAKFILQGKVDIDPSLLTETPHGILVWGSRLCALVWLVILVVLFMIGYWLQQQFPVHPIISWGLYLLFLRYLLTVV